MDLRITEIHIATMRGHDKSGRLLALANIVFNNKLAVHGLRVIRGNEREAFVAMPSKKRYVHCDTPNCKGTYTYDYKYCPQCGKQLKSWVMDAASRNHADVIHPIDEEFRIYIESVVIAELHRVLAVEASGNHHPT